MALPHGAAGWSAVCGCVFYDHTHLLFVQVSRYVFFFGKIMLIEERVLTETKGRIL